ncbi:hypothetical protein CQA53_04820 [Helicobacter didelphidarum]|uniref:Uncharacterized protein n=1 Tax=Helicobacter didelphidarum TaxID=2040648 RepID=A0A3D8ILR3_9HELI|nr:AsmA-like C-terminal domain-containing protein [Helicobacter didelphidarum]RDU66122.1 hypothetical protein CQA53_04820 [Helicobacter didelphidarum]
MPENERNENLHRRTSLNVSSHRGNTGAFADETLIYDGETTQNLEEVEKKISTLTEKSQDFNNLDGKNTGYILLKEENLNARESLTDSRNLTQNLQKLTNKIEYKKNNNCLIPDISQPFEHLFSNHTLKQTITQNNLNINNNILKSHQQPLDSTQYKQAYTMLLNTKEYSSATDNDTPRISIQEMKPNTIKKSRFSLTKNKGDNQKQKKKKSFIRLSILFVLLFVGSIASYRILAKGIFIENINIANIHIQNIFLQLQDRLILRVEKLDLSSFRISKTEDKKQKNFSEILQEIVDYTQKSLFALSYFKILEINDITLNEEHHIKIEYNDTNYKFNMPFLEADFAVTNNQNNFYLKIKKFQLKDIPAHFEGDFIFSIPNKQLLFDLNAILEKDGNTNLAATESLTLKGSTDFRSITITGESTKLENLDIIKPFIQNIKNQSLKATLNGWIFEKVKYSTIRIDALKANIELDNIANSLLKNMIVKASVQKAEVTLNKGVMPILGKEVLLEFKNASLNIIPIQPTFMGMNLNGSEVLIANMPTPDVHILLHGNNIRLDSHFKQLLLSYGLSLPIIQDPLSNKAQKNTTNQITLDKTSAEQAINNTESVVIKALQENKNTQDSKQQNLQNKNLSNQISQSDVNTIPANEITNDQLLLSNNTNIYMQINIMHNNKKPDIPEFFLQGIVQSQDIRFNLYEIPLNAKRLNVALDIAPQQKFIYINGNHIKWRKLIDTDVNILFDAKNDTMKANTYIHQATLNTKNLQDLQFMHNNFINETIQRETQENIDTIQDSQNTHDDVNDLLDIESQSRINTFFYALKESLFDTTPKDSKQELPHNTSISDFQSVGINTENKKQYNQNLRNYRIYTANMPYTESLDNVSNFRFHHSSYTQQTSNLDNNAIYTSALPSQPTYIALTNPHQNIQDSQTIISTQKMETQSDIIAPNILESHKNSNIITPQNINQKQSDTQNQKSNVKKNKAKEEDNEHILKTLKNNPIWDDLKLRTKKTRPFTPLNDQQLENIALKEIEKEKEPFSLEQDFFNMKNASLNFTLSFANNHIILDVPKINLHLESHKDLELKISKIENILQFSPLARYYGFSRGDFSLMIPHNAPNKKKETTFNLNLTNLEYPIYTLAHKKLTNLNIKGRIQENSLIMIANNDIDFKSQDSLSMLRINGYKINIDEIYDSKIPFFIDLLDDKQKDLPYSEAAIQQELRLIAIKNRLRKKMKVNPIDFNILGENLQFIFLGYTMPLDSTNIRFIDGRIIIDGQYEKGILNASLIKDNIRLKARNFSGNFINTILVSAKEGKRMIDGGIFSFDMFYRNGILNATAEIQNTALMEFQAVQNIFALIDTVPSLFMFKNPHISTKGYQINYGKILFAVNSDYIGLQNIFLLGASMDVNGQGIIDRNTEEMNVNLSISTIKNLSKFINKIPVVGYLVLGREGQISTNLIMTGKYTNPKINITLATDIIKTPFNILRRVFPVEIIMENFKEEEQNIDY